MLNVTLTASIRPQALPTILELAVVPVRPAPTRASPRLWGTARPFHSCISRAGLVSVNAPPKVAPAIREGGDSRGLPLPGLGGKIRQRSAPHTDRVTDVQSTGHDAVTDTGRYAAACEAQAPEPSEPAETRRRAVLSCTCAGPLCRSGGPVAKFVSEARNGRIGSAFKLGCPRMAVMKCGPARPIPRPFSNFATGPRRLADEKSARERLAAVPTRANPRYAPPFGSSTLPKALQVIARADQVS